MVDFNVKPLAPDLDFTNLRYWDEGIQAAIHAFKEITSPYWLNEKRLRDSKITLIGEKIAQAARSRKPARSPSR